MSFARSLLLLALSLPEASSLRTAASRTGVPSAVTRRDLLRSGAACAAGVVSTCCAARPAVAANIPQTKIDLNEQLVLILRVKEAASQEARLIKTGKYKEIQRLNVKRAIKFMIDNYSLNERFVKASSFAPAMQVATAGQYGQAAVESLIQILEYFPDKLTANDLTREQEKFVMAALDSTNRNIDLFCELMPPPALAAAKLQIEDENRQNDAEYKEVNDEPMLNVPSAKKAD